MQPTKSVTLSPGDLRVAMINILKHVKSEDLSRCIFKSFIPQAPGVPGASLLAIELCPKHQNKKQIIIII